MTNLEEPKSSLLTQKTSSSRRNSSTNGLLSSTSSYGSRLRSSTTTALLNLIHNGSETNFDATKPKKRFMSLYRLLVLELDIPGTNSTKGSSIADEESMTRAFEQLLDMIKVPLNLEKFMVFGLLVCFNSFLTFFTLVPLKIGVVISSAVADYAKSFFTDFSIMTHRLHFIKRDLMTLALIVVTMILLSSPILEISRLYHDIRGQAHIKLYVMFGVLEVADKLLSSTSQQIFTVMLGIPLGNFSIHNYLKLGVFSFFTLAFFALHSYVLIYQSVSLHVAANSYSNALLALLLSNQFAELKGSVFKKFEREGLFQLSMSDLTERFQLSIMLVVIALRNLSQLSSTELGLIPDSWKSMNKWLGAIFGPSVVVLGSEILVDWLKHCYVIKFNRIRPRVYNNFLYVLSCDFMEIFSLSSKAYTLHEISDYVIVTRRIGLPVISLTICFLRLCLSTLYSVFIPDSLSVANTIGTILLLSLSFLALLVTKLLLSLWLLKWARLIKSKHECYQAQLQKGEGSAKTNPFNETSSPIAAELTCITEKADHLSSSNGLEYSLDEAESPIRGDLVITCESPDRTISHILSAQADLDTSFFPGVPNTESSSINPNTRHHMYDFGESVPPTVEELRNTQFLKNRNYAGTSRKNGTSDSLDKVHRYEMSSKRIW